MVTLTLSKAERIIREIHSCLVSDMVDGKSQWFINIDDVRLESIKNLDYTDFVLLSTVMDEHVARKTWAIKALEKEKTFGPLDLIYDLDMCLADKEKIDVVADWVEYYTTLAKLRDHKLLESSRAPSTIK
jgi:hypothetical protein